MVLGFLMNVLSIFVGALYPAFQSFRAVRTQDHMAILKWSKYWMVFALYLVFGTIAEILLLGYLIPGYDLLKIMILCYIVSPWTSGSEFVYEKIAAPFFQTHEDDFNELLTALSSYLHSTFLKGVAGFLDRTTGQILPSLINLHGLWQQKNQRSHGDYMNLLSLESESLQKTSPLTTISDKDSCVKENIINTVETFDSEVLIGEESQKSISEEPPIIESKKSRRQPRTRKLINEEDEALKEKRPKVKRKKRSISRRTRVSS